MKWYSRLEKHLPFTMKLTKQKPSLSPLQCPNGHTFNIVLFQTVTSKHCFIHNQGLSKTKQYSSLQTKIVHEINKDKSLKSDPLCNVQFAQTLICTNSPVNTGKCLELCVQQLLPFSFPYPQWWSVIVSGVCKVKCVWRLWMDVFNNRRGHQPVLPSFVF